MDCADVCAQEILSLRANSCHTFFCNAAMRPFPFSKGSLLAGAPRLNCELRNRSGVLLRCHTPNYIHDFKNVCSTCFGRQDGDSFFRGLQLKQCLVWSPAWNKIDHAFARATPMKERFSFRSSCEGASVCAMPISRTWTVALPCICEEGVVHESVASVVSPFEFDCVCVVISIVARGLKRAKHDAWRKVILLVLDPGSCLLGCAARVAACSVRSQTSL